MNDGIIGLQDWFETPAGSYLLAWEQQQFDRLVADIFGYHALQLGLPALDALAGNRMSHRWLATSHPVAPGAANARSALLSDYAALPFPEASLDLVALPHALDSHPDPHATLREVARVLVPGGRVVLSGFNPASLWGLRQRREQLCRRVGLGTPLLPQPLEFIGNWRLRDWLRLLDFEVEVAHHGCYRPLVRSEKWLGRYGWMDGVGARWWPFFGAAYFLVAVKRVYGVRLLEPAWRKANTKAAATAPLVRRSGDNQARMNEGQET
ncbi:MAG: methyltransferase domain-containing protein [Burkholderiales bacterium]|nr:methyltransferase domain-containing protein [Burkholderiales bacterium]